MADTDPGVAVSSRTCIDPLWTPLPQPVAQSLSYSYVRYEEVESRFFGGRSLAEGRGYSPLAEGTLVWVLNSKGKQQKSKKWRQKHAGAHTSNCSSEGFNKLSNEMGSKEDDDGGESPSGTRTELFLRARVVSDDGVSSGGGRQEDEGRVLVRYPKGSTYRVRRKNLVPVLEVGVVIDRKIVLVVSETPDYRRAATVHTCVGESFLEIGCDFGPCVDRVRRVLTEVGGVPLDPKDKAPMEQGGMNDDGRVMCLGIDKSPQSIDIALERYPETCFSLEDALTDDGTTKLRSLCRRKLVGGYPSVVAIDINGNRELPAVLQCLENIMHPGADATIGENWNLPRLIIVKSRTLYNEVLARQKMGLRC